ncbi:porin [Rhodovulum adriaticum]|uniref:Outer membrane protein OmpU n=1 Tax=Rhodovulum adriaticum TaxID=35804 RepID=A0A4V2SMG3_RHOAD|nr:porin [Rhodovulum adriaticum]MBK1634251.1 hypothetical protein [Rhodovulum adriaticum]TCP27196.1 outer membrane protein OmpU [Rhodovulum adriaticum]
MKKVLFATTALVASTGFAAAQGIDIGASVEMGVVGGGNNTGVNNTQFHTSTTINFSAEGETDGGLTYGFNIRADADGRGINGATTWDNEYAYISGVFGTLTLGETDGAVDKRITEGVGNPGSIADDETTHIGYMGSFGDGAYDNQILRYDYDFAGFGISLSTELDDTDTVDDGYAVAVSYDTEFSGVGVGFGLGYQSLESDGTYIPGNLGNYFAVALPVGTDVEIVAVSVDLDFNNGFVAGLAYSQWDLPGADVDHIQVSAGYTFDAFSIGANYGQYDLPAGFGTVEGYGLAASYDLGGGAAVHFGYGDSSWSTVLDPASISGTDAGQETWSLGIAMSF